ncbi:hypothetical protein STCU_01550 [Strigomonas culicis]|uniref:Uncharacterized protein n=1 Tax=Strigomonas culicis TaxID=28005 RepID=S9UFR0_9TRYP|nr:hypothetical protein STCU_04374 [Strigomonas culicis]EPY34509.1 hypothetical protein STCU_01550 [Strigomonas culicis]|eukprot:EPY29647.1 hypothetical protein STCU_04374 [Strigomonas culicis]
MRFPVVTMPRGASPATYLSQRKYIKGDLISFTHPCRVVAMPMLLAVFHEFAHPEILEQVQRDHICDVDVAAEPNRMATSEEEKKVVRTNAKLIKVKHTINAQKDVFDDMTQESYAELEQETDVVLGKLTALGFVVENRNPVTSAGCPMVDRVILSFPE